MKYFKLLEQYTKEAEKDDIFGEYLFSEERSDLKGVEKNTEDEKLFLIELQKHFYSGPEYRNNLTKWLLILKKLKKEGKYLDFIQPKSGKVYRILVLSIGHELLNFDEDVYEETRGKLCCKENVILKPLNKKYQSWTYNLEHSYQELDFEGDLYGNESIVILETNTDKADFYINYEFLNDVDTFKINNLVSREQETISIGNVKCDKMYFYTPLDNYEWGNPKEPFTLKAGYYDNMDFATCIKYMIDNIKSNQMIF